MPETMLSWWFDALWTQAANSCRLWDASKRQVHVAVYARPDATLWITVKEASKWTINKTASGGSDHCCKVADCPIYCKLFLISNVCQFCVLLAEPASPCHIVIYFTCFGDAKPESPPGFASSRQPPLLWSVLGPWSWLFGLQIKFFDRQSKFYVNTRCSRKHRATISWIVAHIKRARFLGPHSNCF